jgi:DNA-binding NarL/FixJ family response regulator
MTTAVSARMRTPPLTEVLDDDPRRLAPIDLPRLEEIQLRRARLTSTEDHVFRMVAEGHSLKAIARLLGRSRKTIDSHMVALHKKLEAHDRVILTRMAYRLGLLEV